MKNIIRIGDKTSGGGTVITGSSSMIFDGIGVAREGDAVDCPIPGHGRTVIAEGHPHFCDHGVPVAFHGHACAYGCTLVSSMPAVTAS